MRNEHQTGYRSHRETVPRFVSTLPANLGTSTKSAINDVTERD